MVPLLAIITALPVSLAIIPIMVRLAPMLGMVDQPNERKVHVHPVPRVGGWGIICGAVASVLLWLPLGPLATAYVLGALILLFAGALDDSRDLSPSTKLLLQFAATAPVIGYAGLEVSTLPLGIEWELPRPLAVGLTSIGLVACINALNTSDGLDGLAGGEALISLAAILFLAFMGGSTELVFIAASAAGALLGFLHYNTHPATIFMGDSGSQFLGFTVGFLALALVQPEVVDLSPWNLLMIVGLPLADLGIVALRRLLRGSSCFRADRTHIHHRFLELGFTHAQSVIVIYLIHASMVFFAIALKPSKDTIVLLVYLLHLVIVYGFLHLAASTVRGQHSTAARLRRESRQRNRSNRLLIWPPRVMLEILAPLALVLCAALAGEVPRDLGVLAVLLLMPLSVGLATRTRFRSLLTRPPIFLSATALVYVYTETRPFTSLASRIAEISGFSVLALAIVMALQFSPARRQREFHTTATDYLLLILVVIALFGLNAAPGTINGYFLVYLPIVLYGCELLTVERRERREWLPAGILAATAILAVRGLL